MDTSIEVRGLAIATAVAICSGLYYANACCPEISAVPNKSRSEFKKIRLEAFSNYTTMSDTEVYWGASEDVSGWKFSTGGYFIGDHDTVLPSDKVQTITEGSKWISAEKPVDLWILCDKPFLEPLKKCE